LKDVEDLEKVEDLGSRRSGEGRRPGGHRRSGEGRSFGGAEALEEQKIWRR